MRFPGDRPGDERFQYLHGSAKIIHESTDRWVIRATADVLESGRGHIECEGCRLGYCCEQPVFATALDALPIASNLIDAGCNSVELRRLLWASGLDQEVAVEQGTEDQRRRPCPFLDSKHECSVYEDRPVNCRAYMVFGGRDACTPYCDRTDGRKPLVSVVDNVQPVETVMRFMMHSAMEMGWERGVYLRALSCQVAMWMEAALEIDATGFWRVVRERSSLPPDQFLRMAERQAQNPMRRGAL